MIFRYVHMYNQSIELNDIVRSKVDFMLVAALLQVIVE